MMDHLRRRLVPVVRLRLRPRNPRESSPTDGVGVTWLLLALGTVGVIKIGSWGRLVPIGGRLGSRLSNNACARLICPSSSSSSSSTSTVDRPEAVVGRSLDRGACNACRKLSRVGDASGGGTALGRAADRSRFAGRCRLPVVEVVGGWVGTETDTA